MSLTPGLHEFSASPSSPKLASPQDTRTRRSYKRWVLRCEGDEITEISRDGVVLLEALRPALRDADWDTIPGEVVESSWTEDHRCLRRFQEIQYNSGPADVHAVTELEVSAHSLSYRYALTPRTDLTTNRAGLNAMLPRTVSGLDGLITTPDDAGRPFRFPHLISPYQPAFDIRSLELCIEGIRVRLDLLGDVFEMEDQRNWTDSSFKIYSRPLALPFPYVVRARETIEQAVTVTALPDEASLHSSSRSESASPVTDVEELVSTAPCRTFPALGVGATTQYSEAVSSSVPGLRGLSHLLVETCDGFPQELVLGSAAREADSLGVPVDLRIAATEETDLDAILAIADDIGLPLARLAVVDARRHVTTGPLWELLCRAADGRNLELIAGARSHFTEFNREIHDIPRGVAAVTFPSTPQMHMHEPWHVVTSIAALGDVLETATALRPDQSLHLGPVTLRPRVNAVATRPELVDRNGDAGYGAHLVPGANDPHQHSPWAGAWAAAVILQSAAAGVHSVSIAELAGPRGLLLPDGELAPIGEIVSLLAGLTGRTAQIVCDAAGPGTALALCDDQLLIVNARLEDWDLELGAALTLSESMRLRVPAGTWRGLTVPAARPTP